MKKQMMILMLGLLLVGSVIAISFNNKEDLINAFLTYKEQREGTITAIASEITYTSDKKCVMDYNSEVLVCEICISYEYDASVFDNCISVDPDYNSSQVDDRIRDYVRKQIRNRYPIETYTYTEEGYNGRVLK